MWHSGRYVISHFVFSLPFIQENLHSESVEIRANSEGIPGKCLQSEEENEISGIAVKEI